MSRAGPILIALAVAVSSATAAGAARPTKGAPLVQFAAEDQACTTSKTIFLTVGADGVRALECEGRPYNGPLSAVQYDAVIGLATALLDGDELASRDRKRVQAYARAVVRGENVAELDPDAAEAEITALVTHVLQHVVADDSGRLSLVSNPADPRSPIVVVRELVALLEGGKDRRADVEALVHTPLPNAFGPIGISTMKVRLDGSATSAVAEVGVYNFKDELSAAACTTDRETLDTVCTIEVVFSDGAWKLSGRGFERLFQAMPSKAAEDTTTTTVS